MTALDRRPANHRGVIVDHMSHDVGREAELRDRFRTIRHLDADSTPTTFLDGHLRSENGSLRVVSGFASYPGRLSFVCHGAFFAPRVGSGMPSFMRGQSVRFETFLVGRRIRRSDPRRMGLRRARMSRARVQPTPLFEP